jgi:putative membrane protein
MDPIDLNGSSDDAESIALMPLKYLHPVSLIFDLLAHARSYLLPIVFGLLGAANGNATWLIVSAVLFVPAVASSVIRYFTLKYRIKGNYLVVDQGLLFRKTRTIPVDRIQNIDLTQNVLHRIFGVAEVKIETASGSEAEATLRVLSLEEVESLRSIIFQTKSHDCTNSTPSRNELSSNESAQFGHVFEGNEWGPAPAYDGPNEDHRIEGDLSFGPQREFNQNENHPSQARIVWQIPLMDLAQAGLASNRGLILVGIAFGAAFQFGENSYQSIYEWVSRILPESTGSLAYYLNLAAMVVAALVLLRLMGIGWYILRFYDYRLTQRGDDLRIACGLFTKVSATIPRNRIQFVSVQQNLIMRWMRLATIRIETAGGAIDSSNPAESVAKSWFMPVIPIDDVPQIIRLLRPGLDWNEQQFGYRGLSNRAASRFTRLAIIQSIGVAAIAGYFYWPWGVLAGFLVLPLFIFWARKKAASRKYARTENAVIYRSGILERKTSVTFFEKIQAVTCEQNPFDRRWAMATLAIDTAAAGPAEHRIATAYLDANFAAAECEILRRVSVDPALAEAL